MLIAVRRAGHRCGACRSSGSSSKRSWPGKSQREVARLYGISQPRVSQLVAAWRAGGWEALEPRSRRPRTNPNATPPDGRRRVLALRTELVVDGCDAGPHSIAALLARDMDSPPGVTTIWRILTRAGVDHARAAQATQALLAPVRRRPAQRVLAGRLHPLAPGRRHATREILLWLDDHSRYLISATVHRPVTGRIVLATFRAACTLHGTPQSTLTDNGLVFTTRLRGGPNAFEIELPTWASRRRTARPNHPQTQGKVERLNQTLKRWLAARPAAPTLADLQAQLDAVHRLLQHPPHPTAP